MSDDSPLIASHVSRLSPDDPHHPAWRAAAAISLNRYWSGAKAPSERHAEARAIWDERALAVRFVCAQHEPLIVNSAPQVERKTIGLWERDVCEIFLAPGTKTPVEYFEFEVAPTGEWIDLKIRMTPEGKQTDWGFASGMRAVAAVDKHKFTLILSVPWEAIGQRPATGEEWRANLFRCVGAGETRGYLAWRPTRTPAPSFHVPAAFGRLIFG